MFNTSSKQQSFSGEKKEMNVSFSFLSTVNEAHFLLTNTVREREKYEAYERNTEYKQHFDNT